MNPHKVVDAYLPTENLRLGADYQPARAGDAFHVSRRWRLVREGVAALHRRRRVPQAGHGTMCPSYMATLEEGAQHARPRAHAVRDAAGRGAATAAGRTSRSSRRSTCASRARPASRSARPTSTSRPIAPSSCRTTTRRDRRPLHAYAFGMIDRWARLRLDRAAAGQCAQPARPASAGVLRRLLHLAPQRELPRLAPQSFPPLGDVDAACPMPAASRPATSSCGRTPSTTTSTRRRARRRSRC